MHDGLIETIRSSDDPGDAWSRRRLGRTRVLGHPDQRPVGTFVLQSRPDRRAGRGDRPGPGRAGNGPALPDPDHRARAIICCMACGRSPPPARRLPMSPRESWASISKGPFISERDGYRGAHPAASIRDPDWSLFQELQKASGGRIVLMTLAPERAGAIEFIRRATAAGVVDRTGAHGRRWRDDSGRDRGRRQAEHAPGQRHRVASFPGIPTRSGSRPASTTLWPRSSPTAITSTWRRCACWRGPRGRRTPF